MKRYETSKVSLLTGGADRPYNLGLLQALVEQGIQVDFIGNDEMRDADITKHTLVNYLNLRGSQNPDASPLKKITRIFRYYLRLVQYAFQTDSKLFHIQWYNKFTHFDRTVMNLYYRMIGKKLVFTAHNVNERQRDGNDNALNRFTLKLSYRAFDHILVHTPKMKEQLINEFGVSENKVSVIRFGINSTVPDTDLSRENARKMLNLSDRQKTLLFFGNIAPYKGIEFLILALSRLRKQWPDLRLIIAGRIKGCDGYWSEIKKQINGNELNDNVVEKIEYIPENEVQIYFKAADVLILPYTFIFQSGVVFLSYNFGLPVIGANVGGIEDDIVEGKTGYVFRKGDYEDLADKIVLYFSSELYRNLDDSRNYIVNYARTKYSWDEIGRITCQIYDKVVQPPASV